MIMKIVLIIGGFILIFCNRQVSNLVFERFQRPLLVMMHISQRQDNLNAQSLIEKFAIFMNRAGAIVAGAAFLLAAYNY
jgi:hypothetical protein